MRTKEQQIRCWVRKHKALINEASAQQDKYYLVTLWKGYLNGMLLTNAITMQEYNTLYDEMCQYACGYEAEQRGGCIA